MKTLTITEEAYQLLAREKKTKESFSEVIKRLTNERGKLTDSLGTCTMDDQEEERIFSKLETHWKKKPPQSCVIGLKIRVCPLLKCLDTEGEKRVPH